MGQCLGINVATTLVGEKSPATPTPSRATPVARVAPAGAPAPKQRIVGLDALRGLAAVAVLLGHYTANYHRLYGHDDRLLFYFPWAGYGVLLFFMISGFVILMTADRTARPADFAWARFSRLYPAYWTAVLVTFLAVSTFGLPGREPSLRLAVANVTMFQNLFGVGNVDAVYWTLHVELYFYALMFVLLWRGWVRFTEVVLLGLVALAAIDRAWLSHFDAAWAGRLRDVLILDHAYAFLIGVILYRTTKSPRWWHGPALAACFAYAFAFEPRADFYATIALAGVVLLATRGRLKFLESRPLVFLGTISYPLYLTHQNIGYVVIRAAYKAGLHPNAGVLLATAVAAVVAVAITYAVERPAMAFLRDMRPQFRRARTPSRQPAAVAA